ncbi:hypothetical protein ACFJIX_18015 [Roseateles sp. UC29_93]|uniref:hypothetical protein n=1 Tax=Roseateles sp. UC29_93 TaxID=3350177 RepID=UPI00366B4A13
MSGRDLTPEAIALLGNRLGAAVFLEMLLDVPLYLSNAEVPIDFGGHTWLGVSQLQIKAVAEGSSQAEKLQFSLPAVPNEYLGLALSTEIRGKRVNMYMGIMHPDTMALVQMLPLWGGQLDQMPVSYGPETASIAATAEHRAVSYARPKPLRYTDADQRRLYPGDRCLEYLIDQSQKEDTWPSREWFKR